LCLPEQVRRSANVVIASLDLSPKERKRRYAKEAARQAYYARRNAQAAKLHRKTRKQQFLEMGIDPEKIKSVPPKPAPC